MDIDHVIPTSKARDEKEIKKLNHYSNLQLLPTYYNRHEKSNKEWDAEHFDNWFNTF